MAIPSASALPAQPREFIVYESSLSDILGVLVFYSWLGADGSLEAFAADLFGGGALSLIAALVAAGALFYFINQITGHVRFLPLLFLEGWSLHWSGISAVWHGEIKRRWLELALLLVHTATYTAAVFLVLSPLKAVAFIVLHQGLWGVYMGLAFAPNHKGMPTTTGEQEWDVLRKQVLTSRNVDGGPWVDVALGGLNHQIEHHLFPSMPRANLRRSRTVVREFCATHDIPYHQTTLVRSYAEVLGHLHAVGAPLRARG